MKRNRQELVSSIHYKIRRFLAYNRVLTKYIEKINNNEEPYKKYNTLYEVIIDYIKNDELNGLILCSIQWGHFYIHNGRNKKEMTWSEIHDKYIKFYVNNIASIVDEIKALDAQNDSKNC